jgi:hypothetical protein
VADESLWVMIGALGSVGSTVVAGVGLYFVGWQIREARKASDLESLVEFYRAVELRETNFSSAVRNETSDGESVDEAYHSLLNLLEVYAGAHNMGLLLKASRDFVRDKLLDAAVLIESNPRWRDKRAAAILSDATFSEWDRFLVRHKNELTIHRKQLSKSAKLNAR